jgi:hypothetical protein
MRIASFFSMVFLLTLAHLTGFSQKIDSVLKNPPPNPGVQKTDTTSIPKSRQLAGNDPRKATLYSAILPGLGQIYNKKYWKLPLVYGALGIPAYAYFYNKEWYKKTAYALAVLVNGSYLTSPDSLSKVDPKLVPFITAGANNSLINYRNEFRKDQDYSALFFILFWGLQIIDATVDAHLKPFDVSPNLSLEIRPSFIAGPNAYGLSFLFDIHQARPQTRTSEN